MKTSAQAAADSSINEKNSKAHQNMPVHKLCRCTFAKGSEGNIYGTQKFPWRHRLPNLSRLHTTGDTASAYLRHGKAFNTQW